MARAVRRVSRVSTKDQKKDKLINKKLIWILSIVFVVLLGVGLGLGIYFGTRNDEKYVSDKIYFNEEIEDTNGHKVTFIKENYQTINRFIKNGTYEHIFVFAYDGSAFYADSKDEENYNKEYENLITRIADLQYAVNVAKESDVNIEFFIVDVHVDDNSDILSDSKFGSLSSGSSDEYSPAFIYIEGDVFKKDVEIGDDKFQVSTGIWTDVYNSSIKYAINFIDSLK